MVSRWRLRPLSHWLRMSTICKKEKFENPDSEIEIESRT